MVSSRSLEWFQNIHPSLLKLPRSTFLESWTSSSFPHQSSIPVKPIQVWWHTTRLPNNNISMLWVLDVLNHNMVSYCSISTWFNYTVYVVQQLETFFPKIWNPFVSQIVSGEPWFRPFQVGCSWSGEHHRADLRKSSCGSMCHSTNTQRFIFIFQTEEHKRSLCSSMRFCTEKYIWLERCRVTETW